MLMSSVVDFIFVFICVFEFVFFIDIDIVFFCVFDFVFVIGVIGIVFDFVIVGSDEVIGKIVMVVIIVVVVDFVFFDVVQVGMVCFDRIGRRVLVGL